MIAALRDIWHMAKQKGFARSYQDAYQLLIDSGKYRLMAGINEPVMVRPKRVMQVLESDSPARLEIPLAAGAHG